MYLETPDDLGVTLVVAVDDGTAFALCHPGSDGPPDMQTSVVLLISPPVFSLLRVFDTQIISMAVRDGALYCVDASQHVYVYSGGAWTDVGNPDLRPYRINDLRTVGADLFGIGNDRMIFAWTADRWVPVTEPQKGLYLYDIARWGQDIHVVSGEDGYLASLQAGVLRQIDLPTNADLTCVLPLSERQLLITGWDATAMIFSEDEATIIDPGARDLNFLNAVHWQGHVLIAAENEILALNGAGIETFAAQYAALLNVGGSRLWRQGTDGIGYLDPGQAWVSVPLAVDLPDWPGED
jgi:hypothetical protein